MLPESLKAPLREHLTKVTAIHEQDLTEGWGRVQMPTALDRKYPNAPKEWRWQWVFPQENRWTNRQTQEQGRHHIDESLVQKSCAIRGREGRPDETGHMSHLPPFLRHCPA